MKKVFTIRLPEALAARILEESKARDISKSDVVRERLEACGDPARRRVAPLDAIADLIGTIDDLPADLSARRKHHLRVSGYGRKRPR